MVIAPVLLDSDTMSELSRRHPVVVKRAAAYLAEQGRLTISAITMFERLRGYRDAIRAGRPFEPQLRAFEALVSTCVVLPFDDGAATVASDIWSAATQRQRRKLGDILIAAIAASRQLPLATRNRRDFQALATAAGIDLRLVDWTRPAPALVRRRP